MGQLSSYQKLSIAPDPDSEENYSRRTWKQKFKEAARGIKFGVRGQSSFFVHFFFAAMVIAAAIAMQCEIWEWCILIGCIGFVLVIELINSAIEKLFQGLPQQAQDKVWPCLDIAAGAVLLASISAAIIGILIFANRLWIIFQPSS